MNISRPKLRGSVNTATIVICQLIDNIMARIPRIMVAEVMDRLAPDLAHPLRRDILGAIQFVAREYRIDPLLLLSVIEVESRFDPLARSNRGALGLMQVRPFVAEAVATRHEIPYSGPTTLLDPTPNIQLGALYLTELTDRLGDVGRALSAYNLGPARLLDLEAEVGRAQTSYARKVLHTYRSIIQDT